MEQAIEQHRELPDVTHTHTRTHTSSAWNALIGGKVSHFQAAVAVFVFSPGLGGEAGERTCVCACALVVCVRVCIGTI